MQINKYRGNSISEAIRMVKNELGDDAMIMSMEKVKKNKDNLVEIMASLPGDNRKPGNLNDMQTEILQIKEMLYLLNNSESLIEEILINPAVLNIYMRLIKRGVNKHYARMFLDEICGHDKNFSENEIQVYVENKLKKILKVGNPFEEKRGMKVISALVGTTGVGKTTTIAKIAARNIFKHKKSVGLISIDNYRIGAVDQLRTYAEILGIPCLPAFNKKNLLLALKKLENRDVILIDTAGQSQYDRDRINELKSMMPEETQIKSQLLLSVNTSENEMEKITTNYNTLNIKNYIFTKIDEAENCGSIINHMMKMNIPISYITTGQNVPEDIISAADKDIVNLILK